MADVVVNDDNFESEVLKSKLPVLVDFYATWCGPCKMLEPVIKELGKDYEGKWKVVGVDVDQSPSTAGQYGIQSIPTLLFFKDGEVVDQLMGFKSKEDIEAKMKD